mgnify:FL=1
MSMAFDAEIEALSGTSVYVSTYATIEERQGIAHSVTLTKLSD